MHGTKEASVSRRDMLQHQNEHFVRGFLTFHTSQLQNRRFPTSFLTNRPQNRRFVRSFRRFSSPVTKCHPCHGICTLSPLRAALTMRFAETCNTTRLKCCACHAKRHRRSSTCCACHEKCNAFSENVAKVFLRLPHTHTPKKRFLTCQQRCWNVTKCHACHAK